MGCSTCRSGPRRRLAWRCSIPSTTGTLKDGTDDQDDTGGRLSFLVTPVDSLRISLVADYFRQGGQLAGGTVTGITSSFTSPPAFSASDRLGFFSPQVASYIQTQTDFLNGAKFVPFQNINHEDNRYWGISATVDWKTPIGTVTVIPAYRDSKLDYTSFATGVMLREMATTSKPAWKPGSHPMPINACGMWPASSISTIPTMCRALTSINKPMRRSSSTQRTRSVAPLLPI